MTMTPEILNVICAVIDYKNFVISNNYVVPKEGFDWYKETESYFRTLPLPDGMKNNLYYLDAILSYGASESGLEQLNILKNTNYEDLCKYKL